MILAVVSDIFQYKALLKKYKTFNNFIILCDNQEFYGVLERENVDFVKIDESLLREYWPQINRWSCEKALTWGKACEFSSFFGSLEADKSVYLFFSYALTALMRSCLFAEYIYKKYNFSDIVIFKFKPLFYPYYKSNYFLNNFLFDIGKQKDIRPVIIELAYPEYHDRKNKVKTFIKKHIQSIYAKFLKSIKAKVSYIVYGELKHLQKVMQELRAEGNKVFLFDIEYNFEQHFFAVGNGFRYYVPDLSAQSRSDLQQRNVNVDWRETLKKKLSDKRFFTFNGIDFTECIWNDILRQTIDVLRHKIDFINEFDVMLEKLNPRALILDEDVSERKSFLAAFFKSKEIPVFCISHGYIPLIDFSLKEAEQKFDLSITFVNSEYEKSMYIARGWDPQKIIVLGKPRYDSLLINTKGRKIHKLPMRILYVASSLLAHTPDLYAYMGIHIRDRGRMIRVYLRDVIREICGKEIELIIKPHNRGEEPLWRAFVRQNSKDKKITVVAAKEDFLKLLSDCDAMIASYWSTALDESAMLNLPTIVLDYYNWNNLPSHPGAGVSFKLVSNAGELRLAIKQIYENFINPAKVAPIYPDANPTYYPGRLDADNTKRVVEYIVNNNLN
jgi:hypothetical protein